MSVISLPISVSMDLIFVELVTVVVWSAETVTFCTAVVFAGREVENVLFKDTDCS